MKITRKKLYVIAPVAVIILFIAGWFIFSTKDYTQVIPGDASVVVSIDVPSIMKTSGLSAKMPEQLKAYADKIYNPGLKLLFHDPANTGISLTDKAYLFASFNKDEPTLIFKVNDEGKLEKSFKQMIAEGMCDELEDHGKYQWTLFHGVGYCAFNKRVLMIVSAETNPENVMVRINELMKQSESDCITSNKAFVKMEQKRADMNIYISFDAIPQATALSMMMGVPSNMSLRDMRILAHLHFDKGRISTDGEYFTENKELQKYIDAQAATAKILNKTFLPKIPSNAIASLSMNLPGDKIYSLLMGFDTFKQEVGKMKMNPNFKVSDFFKSINGDVTMAFTGFNQYTDPKIVMYVAMPNSKLNEALKNLTSQMQMAGMSARPASTPGEYIFENSSMKLTAYATLGRGYLYLTNDELMQQPPKGNAPAPMFTSNLEGMKQRPSGYMLVNPQSILVNGYFNQLLNGLGNIGSTLRTVLGACTAAEAFNKGNNQFQINVYTKDQQNNVLQKIFDK